MTRYIAPSEVVNFMGQMTLSFIRLLPTTTKSLSGGDGAVAGSILASLTGGECRALSSHHVVEAPIGVSISAGLSVGVRPPGGSQTEAGPARPSERVACVSRGSSLPP